MTDQKTCVHITSQGKGGVFKSGSASLVTQFLRDKGHKPRAFDTDPTNATFSRFNLDVQHVDVTNGNQVDLRKFNEVVNVMMSEDGPFVVDTGATIFLAFWDYVAQTGLVDFFAENGRRVVIHCPIMGGQELMETVKGFAAICQMVPDHSIVVWLNSFHGPVEANGKSFEQFAIAQQNAGKILGVVRLSDPMDSIRGLALRGLSEKNRTFAEAMIDSTLIERHVLHGVRKGIWQQLETALTS